MKRHRARRNPLSPTEEVVVTVLGVGALIGLAWAWSVKNQASGATASNATNSNAISPVNTGSVDTQSGTT